MEIAEIGRSAPQIVEVEDVLELSPEQ